MKKLTLILATLFISASAFAEPATYVSEEAKIVGAELDRTAQARDEQVKAAYEARVKAEKELAVKCGTGADEPRLDLTAFNKSKVAKHVKKAKKSA